MELPRLSKILFLSILVSGLLVSGTVSGQSERKMAKAFISLARPSRILLIKPELIYKYNQKSDLPDSLSLVSNEKKDAYLWNHAVFIRSISDSIFLTHFVKGYTKELKEFGIQVYGSDQTGLFFSKGGNAEVVNIAQIELDEQDYLYTDTAFIDENKAYVFRKKLNALDVNFWFEFSRVNATEEDSSDHKVLFVENLLTDQLDGGFQEKEVSGKLYYPFRIDTLTVPKIYTYIEDIGRTYADYTFDYLLNQFLDSHMPPGRRSRHYWRYDPYRKHLFEATTDRFIPLK